MLKRRWLFPSLTALAALTAAFGASPASAPRTFAPQTYREMVGRVTLAVDAYPASLHAKDPFIPLRVAVAVRGKGRPIQLDEGSFTLIDSQGHEIPLASYDELMKEYGGKRVADETLFRHHPMSLPKQFAGLRRVGSRFFPAPGRETRTSSVELRSFTWFRDVIYFRRPEAGLDGILTLRISGGGLDRPAEVKFRIHGVKRESTS